MAYTYNIWSVLKCDDDGKMSMEEAVETIIAHRPKPSSIKTLLKNWRDNTIPINTWCHLCMKGMKGNKDWCKFCQEQRGLEQIQDLRSQMIGECSYYYPIGSEYWSRDSWYQYFDYINRSLLE